MAKSDGSKQTAAKARGSNESNSNAQSLVTFGDLAQKSWIDNPTPPDFYDMATECIVLLTGPVSEEEPSRIWCKILCEDPDGQWRDITDLNGQGTTFEPFNGTVVYDEVSKVGEHKYHAWAAYPNPNDPNDPIIKKSAPQAAAIAIIESESCGAQ